MITSTPRNHINLDSSGVAWIDDTNVKVVEVMLDHITYGHGPEEIHLQHPTLSLAQIHGAFSYYFDHQPDLDAEIDRRYQRVEAIRNTSLSPFSRKELIARPKTK